MKSFLKIVGVCVVIAALALIAIILVPPRRTAPLAQLPEGYAPPRGAGEKVAIAADCVACHTAPGGKPFAGGRAIQSPLGVIYSSNITPDRKNGIGEYTLDDFRAALYDGLRKDGTHLYPAMPYPNYRKLTEADVRALYAWFMTAVTPVEAAAPGTALKFPFDQRWGIRVWNWIALGPAGFTPHMGDATLDRGAYLVEALEHCGACHTPRDALFAEKGYDSRSPDFLAGGEIEHWTAPDLRARNSATQRMSAPELIALLRTARNNSFALNGEMGLAVEHSLQYLPESDVAAIVAYLKAIRQDRDASDVTPPRATPAPTAALIAAASPQMALGARLYVDNCNACHFNDGAGAKGVFPRLDGNQTVVAASPGGLIATILGGARAPSTAERPARLAMPGFAWRLSDEEVAALASFVRGGWSNQASAVTPAEVAAARARLEASRAAAPAH